MPVLPHKIRACVTTQVLTPNIAVVLQEKNKLASLEATTDRHVEKLLHMTICHMEKILHMKDFSPQAPLVVLVTNIMYNDHDDYNDHDKSG